MKANRPHAEQRGFTLVEALVALVIVAFGMLAIAGFQVKLSRDSDVAKQRTEALRLAQEKLEELRSFISTTATGAAFDWTDLPAAAAVQTDTPQTTTNTAYTRNWVFAVDSQQVSGTPPALYSPLERSVRVTVGWTDRAGEAQSVVLTSIISKTDPANIGGLNLPTIEGGILRRPKGRDINIPIPATKLGGSNAGRSSLRFGDDTLIFSDASGDVVYVCAQGVTVTNETNLPSTCAVSTAFLLVGFISASTSSALPAASNLRLRFVAGTNPAVATDFSGTPQCIVDDARDQNSVNTVIAAYRSYVCLVTPNDHPSGTPPGKHWSARVELTTASGTAINSKVCIFGYQPATGATVDNARHPPTYVSVTESLDNQNYLIQASGSCPSGTLLHQNTLPAAG